MATRTRKAAAPQPAPAEPTVEPSIDDIINAGEPLVEIVEDEKPEETAVPATSQLEAPAMPKADVDGIGVPMLPAPSNAQVTPEVSDAGWGEPRREYVDAATRQRVNIEDAFEKVAARGTAYVCRFRIVERMWPADRSEPNSRLVLAQGSRVDAATVEHLTDVITAAHADFPA